VQNDSLERIQSKVMSVGWQAKTNASQATQ